MLDNSQYSINGDYIPTRWMCQIDAAGVLIDKCMQHDTQSTIGIGLMGGKQIQIVCPPTKDQSKVQSYLYGVKQFGNIKLTQALQTAILALKHRANSTSKQKIVCFIASTVQQSIQQLRIVSKKLKKNSIAISIFLMGDLSQQQQSKLQLVYQTVNLQDNSSLTLITPEQNLSQVMVNKSQIYPIMNHHLDDDPELMMALQLSLQDQQKSGNCQEEIEKQALELSLQQQQQHQQQ